ncbi:MAG: hypothetical protein JWM36_3896 [Hyphomicrobiales bacterium]|nr:hypothetical protein [Hyphomicrobiales bacterium]
MAAFSILTTEGSFSWINPYLHKLGSLGRVSGLKLTARLSSLYEPCVHQIALCKRLMSSNRRARSSERRSAILRRRSALLSVIKHSSVAYMLTSEAERACLAAKVEN